MYQKKSRLALAIHVVTLLALLLSLLGVSAVSADPAPVVTDDAATTKGSTNPRSELSMLDAKQSVRVIIQLLDPPLASYAGGKAGLSATSPSLTGAPKLDVASPASNAYLSYLTGKQSTLRADLAKVAPGARVDHAYQVVFNGVAAKVQAGQLAAIRKLAGVKSVTIEREYKLDMDSSLSLIGAGTGVVGGDDWVDSGLWATVGGHENAGKGVKIADIDSGITYSNPCFDPAGYTYPAGFPKFGEGYDAFVNGKVIAARAYFRADDPPKYPATPEDDIEGGHGTHTAGTIACNYGTLTPFAGAKISGVAPKAQLMVYRTFYHSVADSESAWDPELMAAIEDAVKDGADIVNNSWGSTPVTGPETDPLVIAYSAAVDAGVTVVFSAGNNGSAAYTIGSPSFGPKFISVGGVDTGRLFANLLNVTGPGTVPAELLGLGALKGTGPMPTGAVSGVIKYDATNATGCTAFAPGYFTGAIAMVKRGTCNFSVKVTNAQAAGATALIMINNAAGAPIVMGALEATTIPSWMVSMADGTSLINWYTANPGTATVEVLLEYGRYMTASLRDTIYTSSSRGPTPGMLIKPDLSAPAVNVLSSVSSGQGFDLYSGTSMAAPHVTGAAALIKQLHPTWTPAQIKSALMTTSAQPATLPADPTARGSGRLDLAHPNDPGLTFDMPSVSFGLTVAGHTYTHTVTATDVSGMGGTYTVLAVASSGGVTPVVPASITVPANGSASFDVVMTVSAAGAAYGNINLSDGTANHTLHIPFYTRTVADLGAADVLLIDDDNSADDCGPDYSAAYTQMLDNLGLTYKIWEVTPPSYAIDFNQARMYSKVIYFTGDAGTCSNLSGNQTALRNYLANGGRMLITGQDIGALDALLNYYYAVSFNPELFFGASYVQDALYEATTPVPTISGDNMFSSYLAGQLYDISEAGNGAGNQASVDEIIAAFYDDVDALPILLSSPVKSALAYGHLGTRMSSEPTIERVKKTASWTPLGYRTEYLSFGLEGVNNDTGFNTREELLDRLLSWLDDEVTISFTSPTTASAAPYAAVTVSVDAAVSIETTTTGFENSILYYRWDFGDGTAVQTTEEPEAVHGYARPGTYTVYAEAVDAFGHKAVTSQSLTVIPPKPDLTTSTKTVNKATASPEEKLTYTLTIKNTGTAPAPDPWILDTIPAGTTYVADSVTGGAVYDAASNSIKWDGASLAVGAEHAVSFKVQVNADTAVDTVITNEAMFKDVRFAMEVTKSATTAVVPQPVVSPVMSADTYLDMWRPTANFGADGRLMLRAANVQRPMAMFDLSALPAGATIKKAELKLYALARTNLGLTEVGIFQVMRPWNEMQATWQKADAATMWEMAGAGGAGDRAATPAVTLELNGIGTWYTFDVASIVQNWANGHANNGIQMSYVDGDVMVAYTFASSNYMYTPLRPVLTIQYVNP